MGALRDVPVRWLPTNAYRGARNMALDAVAAEHAARNGVASVRVYGWDPSSLTLGYAQDPSTIDWDFCERMDIHVTRRPTGGGAIYHDAIGDVSYSIVTPAEILPDNLMDAYEILCEPILDAFDRMGVPVALTDTEREGIHKPACYLRALHPSHDIVVPGAPDRKISGNAQYRRRDAVVQHGSLTFRLTPERHIRCFSSTALNATTFRDRVTAIEAHAEIDREGVISHLERALVEWAGARAGDWAEWERERARTLVKRKFDAESWVVDRVDPLEGR